MSSRIFDESCGCTTFRSSKALSTQLAMSASDKTVDKVASSAAGGCSLAHSFRQTAATPSLAAVANQWIATGSALSNTRIFREGRCLPSVRFHGVAARSVRQRRGLSAFVGASAAQCAALLESGLTTPSQAKPRPAIDGPRRSVTCDAQWHDKGRSARARNVNNCGNWRMHVKKFMRCKSE